MDFDLVQLGNSVKKSVSIRNVTQIHANWKISIQNSENSFVDLYFYNFKKHSNKKFSKKLLLSRLTQIETIYELKIRVLQSFQVTSLLYLFQISEPIITITSFELVPWKTMPGCDNICRCFTFSLWWILLLNFSPLSFSRCCLS